MQEPKGCKGSNSQTNFTLSDRNTDLQFVRVKSSVATLENRSVVQCGVGSHSKKT